MLKKFFKMFDSAHDSSEPRTVNADDYGISKKHVSQGSLKVIQLLQKSGYQAYLVGGGVRDLLLGGEPKDFDVATNATPEQVNKVFRSARIIGKRFRIVHVRMGREIIEVTTFRGSHTKGKGKEAVQGETGVLLRDNVYGDIQSDAMRRDFTINALYYNPHTNQILDFCNGLEDLKGRTIRIIGDANLRYKEDPVRMIRAVRFAAKLGFKLEDHTQQAILEHAELLAQIPPARLFEEVLKLFANGYAMATYTLLRQYGLFVSLFPATNASLDSQDEFTHTLIEQSLVNTDKRIRSGKRITPAFIYAVFLWPPLQAVIKARIEQDKCSPVEAFNLASQGVIGQQLGATSIPKRFLFPMKDIWHLQQRLEKRDKKRVFSVLEHQRFRAAYDFLLLREQAGEDFNGAGKWWTQFQFASAEVKDTMAEELESSSPSRKPRKRRRKPSANKTPTQNTDNGAPQDSLNHSDQPN